MHERDPTDSWPPNLRRLWGYDTSGRRGPRAVLSIDQIVNTAIALADVGGLASLSMARLGRALECSPMALYRHVDSKDELLGLMADAVAGDLPAIDLAGSDWRRALETWAQVQIDAAVARPWTLELPYATLPLGPNRVRWIDHAFAAMANLELDGNDKLRIMGLLSQHVLAEARIQVEACRAAAATVRRTQGLSDAVPASELDAAALDAAHPYADFGTVLLELAACGTYPHLVAALSTEPRSTVTDDDASDGIRAGLQIVLDGIATFIARRIKPGACDANAGQKR